MRRRSFVFTLGLMAAFAVPVPGYAAPAPEGQPKSEWREVFSEDGTIKRVFLRHRVPNAPNPSVGIQLAVTQLINNGPSSSKFDLVFVGDGYTSSQLGTYATHVTSKLNQIMAMQPFAGHQSQFNAWRVDVISTQSGVDNDPTFGVTKNTALDMYFWCGGLDRLLCVNETKALQAAANAPDADQVIAIANSTTYGGAGGTVATASGGHASSGQIAIHELGHSIGGLADEYDYADGSCYPFSEPTEPNVSRLTSAQMQAAGTKWASYLGQSTPDGGTIGTYQGARYYSTCIYRPSSNSIMRTLGQQFNSVSRDVMVTKFYTEP